MKNKKITWISITKFLLFALLIGVGCKKEDERQIPELTTKAVREITKTTASSGGVITSDGGSIVTSRGICWSINPSPIITDSKTTDGTGIGYFTSSMSDLNPNTTYYVRAYATNDIGTAYGNEISFSTNPATLPELTTSPLTSITINSAECGGNITSDGLSAITIRGVCWSTSQNPTITDNHTVDGAGTGTFTSSLTGLTQGTNYYARAYATNSIGTSYGNQITISTPLPDGPGSTLTDADGNVYNTVWINGRQWTKENLRTTKYNDGSSIALVDNRDLWYNTYTPAYCWLNDDKATYGNFGALYNWYAVNSSKLCPVGWHIPSDAEWYAMENYVDQTINDPNATGWRGTTAGTKLKATTGWSNGGNGTDDYGFSALPRGSLALTFTNSSSFFYSTDEAVWWCGTDSGHSGWRRIMESDSGKIKRDNSGDSRNGFSVRCIKDL